MTLSRIDALPRLPKRTEDGHKGLYGTILVVGGSRGMAGAPALCGASALRSGAGLVRIVAPKGVEPVVATFEPSYMTYPVAEDEEGLMDGADALRIVEKFLPRADVLAVGPGLGTSDGLARLVAGLIETVAKPIVLDADGLNNLVGAAARRPAGAPLVVTPHPGEAARLLGRTTAEIQADRPGAAVELAKRFGAVAVLKGHGTIVTDGAGIFVNSTGNPGMATGGAGDVLTGVIAALIGQGLSPIDAACMGVYAHGLAGDIAKDRNGEMGLIAGDLVDSLADTFGHLAM